MDDQVRMTEMATQLSNVSKSSALVLAELGELRNENLLLRRQVHSLRGTLKTALLILSLILALLATVIGAAVYAGKSLAKETIREVVQAESRDQLNITQHGMLSNRFKILDSPATFEWTLKQPIAVNRLVAIVAEPSASLPSMAVEARCVKDGKACQIIVHGSTTKFLELLEEGIQCKVILTFKAD